MNPLVILAVMGAGAVGALARYAATLLVRHKRFPWAILAVNVAGSLLGGIALGVAPLLGPDATLIVLTGLCGGMTTFSTFSVDTVRLIRSGRRSAALANVAANLALSLGAAAAGYAVVAALR